MRPFATLRQSSRPTARRRLAVVTMIVATIVALGIAGRVGPWFSAGGGADRRQAPSVSGPEPDDRSDRLSTGSVGETLKKIDEEASNSSADAERVGNQGVDRALTAGRISASGNGVTDASQGDAALFAAWDRLEQRVASAVKRARESVVALEYTPADAAPGARRLATGVVINHRGDVLSVRIDRPSANVTSHDRAAIVARDASGRRHSARWVASDSQTGLTLLRVASRAMKPIRTAANEPELGSQVFVVGNPFGMGHSVSRGYVAGLERTLEFGSRQLGGLIQIQTPLYPGDSGAVVVNLRGEWLGMIRSGLAVPGSSGVWAEPAAIRSLTNSVAPAAAVGAEVVTDDDAANSRSDPDNGFGFAIPARDALWIADRLHRVGRVDRAYLGVRLDMGWSDGANPSSLSQPDALVPHASNLRGSAAWSSSDGDTTASAPAATDGAVLREILPGTPAEAGGLHPGDVIVSLDGLPIHSAHELTDRLDRVSARTTIQLGIIRSTGAKTGRIDLSLRTVNRPDVPVGTRASEASASQPGLPVMPTASRTVAPTDGGDRPNDPARAHRDELLGVPSSEPTPDARLKRQVIADRPEPATPRGMAGVSPVSGLGEPRPIVPNALMERVEQLERRLENLERPPARPGALGVVPAHSVNTPRSKP